MLEAVVGLDQDGATGNEQHHFQRNGQQAFDTPKAEVEFVPAVLHAAEHEPHA